MVEKMLAVTQGSYCGNIAVVRVFSKITALFVLLISYATTDTGQETVAILSGVVADGKGIPVGGATVSVLNEPAGTSLTAQTNNKDCLYCLTSGPRLLRIFTNASGLS